MAFNETGHAQNAAKFHTVTAKVTTLGAVYSPSRAAIKLPQLLTLSTNADSSITAVDNALTGFNNSTNAREIEFAKLSPLVTRVINALKATEATAQTIKDAVALEKKIQGTRATPKPKTKEPPVVPPVDPPPVPPVFISASQMQFNSRIENFSKLIVLLTAEPLYIPNEADLKIIGLNTYLTTLSTVNSSVITFSETLITARKNRNTILYLTTTGLYDIQNAVKKYVRSLSGQASLFKELSKIKFSRPRKKDLTF